MGNNKAVIKEGVGNSGEVRMPYGQSTPLREIPVVVRDGIGRVQYSDEIGDYVAYYLALGAPLGVIADSLSMSESIIRRWLKGRRDLRQVLARRLLAALEKRIGGVRAEWWLEKRFPEIYGRRGGQETLPSIVINMRVADSAAPVKQIVKSQIRQIGYEELKDSGVASDTRPDLGGEKQEAVVVDV